jgi:hypothetical protein
MIINGSVKKICPCYSGRSLVRCYNKITKKISDIPVCNVLSDVHEVYSSDTQKFVPVIYNIVAGMTNRYMLIKKDSIAINQPFKDFYITSEHQILINGIEVKAKHVLQAKRVKVKLESLYSICTKNREPILINGLEVMTWSLEEWLDYSLRKNIIWTDNNRDTNNNEELKINKQINNLCDNEYTLGDYVIRFINNITKKK